MATIKVKSVDEIIHILEKRVSRIKQVAILNEIGQYMKKQVTERFKYNRIKPKTTIATLMNRRSGTSSGKGKNKIKHVKNLKKQTALIGSQTTLVDTKDLMNSIEFLVHEGKKRVEIGTNLDYAAIHQFGGRTGKNKKTKIPKRPYLYFTSVNRLFIKRLIKNKIEGK